MEKYIKQEHNAATGEIIISEMSEKEIEEIEFNRLENIKYQQAKEAKQAIRQSALSKLIDLGLTEEEIASL